MGLVVLSRDLLDDQRQQVVVGVAVAGLGPWLEIQWQVLEQCDQFLGGVGQTLLSGPVRPASEIGNPGGVLEEMLDPNPVPVGVARQVPRD
jgi:hypothetical protein